MRWILIAAAGLGALSVVMGAVVEHAAPHLGFDETMQSAARTAVRYHQFYSLVLLVLGLYAFASHLRVRRLFYVSVGLFLAGMSLFSFSIYAWVLTGIRQLTMVTPLGGILLIGAWLLLAVYAWRLRLFE